MELLTIQHIGEAAPRHIITACDDTDTCPSCGAGYRVGLTACEYCRMPVVSHCKPVGPPNQAFGMFGEPRKKSALPMPRNPVPLEQVKCRYW